MEKSTIEDILMSGFKLDHVLTFDDVPKSDQNHEGKRNEIQMTYIGEMPTTCPDCGNKLYAHTGKEILVTDTTFVGFPTKLKLSFPRKRCKKCGYIYYPKVAASTKAVS